MEDAPDVGFCVSALFEQGTKHLQIRDRIQIFRRLFRSETSIKIAADRDVTGVSGKLTDVVDVIDRGIQCHLRALRPISSPIRHHHPRVERRTDDAIALDDGPNLIVVKLAVPRSERAAIVVAGHDVAME